MAVKDWTRLHEDYKGLWVALADDEMTVLASAKKLKTIAKKYPRAIFYQVPTSLNAGHFH